jgi:hypothetical protein
MADLAITSVSTAGHLEMWVQRKEFGKEEPFREIITLPVILYNSQGLLETYEPKKSWLV